MLIEIWHLSITNVTESITNVTESNPRFQNNPPDVCRSNALKRLQKIVYVLRENYSFEYKKRLQVHVLFRLPHKIVINGGIQNYFLNRQIYMTIQFWKFLSIFNTDSGLFIA